MVLHNLQAALTDVTRKTFGSAAFVKQLRVFGIDDNLFIMSETHFIAMSGFKAML